MSSWKGKTRGGLLGYQIFIYILKKSGVSAAYVLLRIVACYYVIFAPKSTSAIYSYFRDILGFNRLKACQAVYKSYYIFGQTLIDKIAIGSGQSDEFQYTFDGVEHLETLKETGGVVISAHLGNWEIAGFLLDKIKLTTNILIYEAEHEKIKNYLDQVMKDRKVNIIAIKNDLSHIFKINTALRNKEVICMHGDRFTSGGRVVRKVFMGKNAFFPLGPFTIATKLKVPYSFAYAVRGKGKTYHLSATPIQNAESTAEELLDQYVEHLETKMKQTPLQWFNYYDFWSEDVKGAVVE
ncbi:lipid A biosynthesis acyltransferase [Fulvivirga kasyanovii]|uniref:Lipid A biosynthesis acyltransferase n=1 Tax=Fulvivirga kasyanovii TaxID=396812 RepID=A0ABW9RRQ5_9BACT|nr:lipid A biosynthesis acyltransferase [Fulvivirga kasyanovii]MTI25665.1 lipid A biosynthesis acyltransferase [Fulvivirga kasyanovii]